MKKMLATVVLVGTALTTPMASAVDAARIDREVLKVREAAWRAWFAGGGGK